jgi:hypothetical protein
MINPQIGPITIRDVDKTHLDGKHIDYMTKNGIWLQNIINFMDVEV